MNCLECGANNPAGARFCCECGSGETRSAQRLALGATAARERRPREYTPNHLIEKILTSRSALEGERKQVTVLFVDLKGSMHLAREVDVEELHSIMDRFFAILSEGIHQFEGTINQFTGDGIMALFGAPIAHEDHAARACHAALHLAEALRSNADDLRLQRGLNFSVRMGMNSGEVVVGKIGDDLRMDYTAQGHSVGVAARMEQLAEAGRCYLTEHTASLVAGLFELRDLGETQVKGLTQPMRIFELLGPGVLRTRFDIARLRGLSPFVGRDHELGRLSEALEAALQGQGQVVGIAADAGVGKSRLCFEFLVRCRSRGIFTREAHALPHGKKIPLLPVLEMLRSIFGISERDKPALVRQKVAGAMLLMDPELSSEIALLFEFLGVAEPERSLPLQSPEERQQRLLAFVAGLVAARSRRGPAVYLLEDLHWVDAGSNAFLAQLVAAAAETRSLILTTFRPGYRAPWMSGSHYQQIDLPPLDAGASRALLAGMLGNDPSVLGLSETVCDRTGGNPLFMEEVVRSLIESGDLEGEGEGYRLVRTLDRLLVPDSVQSVIAARIDRLAESEKLVLQTAAVIGKTFPGRVLEKVVDMAEGELDAVIESLIDTKFLRQISVYPDEEYAFVHPLTREVAYASQLGERRVQIHAAVASAVEVLQGNKLDQNAALLAHHAESAGHFVEAAAWHGRAAEWVGHTDIGEAHRHWRTALALLGDAPESEERDEIGLAARLSLMRLSWRLGFASAETGRLYTATLSLSERLGDERAIAQLKLEYAAFRAVAGDDTESHQYRREAALLAETLRDRELSVAARSSVAASLLAQGKLREGVAETDGVELQAFDAEGPARSAHIYLLGVRGILLTLMGRFEEGAASLERAQAGVGESSDPEIGGYIHGFWVQHARCLGEPTLAQRHGRCALECAERGRTPLQLALAYVALGNALGLARAWNEALDAFQRARAIVESRGSLSGLRPRILVALAQSQLGKGEAARAERSVREALTSKAMQSGALVTLSAQLTLVRALLRTEGAAKEVQAALSRAHFLVDTFEANGCRPLLHEVLAELAQRAGRPEVQQWQLRHAQRLYTALGATGHARRIAPSAAATRKRSSARGC